MFSRIKFIVLISSIIVSSIFCSKEVFLTPPILNSSTIAQEIVCVRPMRNGKFNLSTQNIGSKLVVNCYGHGGSGWTTLFGSVNKAIKLFEQTNPDKQKPIRVIGSGCMGLTCAIELTNLGYKVSEITTKEKYNISSWRAAGYFALVSVKTSPEEQENLNEIGIDTFKTCQKIEKGEHPYISKKSVRYMPVYTSNQTECGVEELEKNGLIAAKELVTLNFAKGVIHENYYKYMTYFMDTTMLMKQLYKKVKQLKIPIQINEIKSFEEINEEIIFNCSGLGAKELNHDENMIPVRGHLLILNKNAGTEHMNYMIYTTVQQDDKEEYIYMFPKNSSVTPDNKNGLECAGTLGGTFIVMKNMSEQELSDLDKREFKKLLDRNALFFYGKKLEELN